MLQRLFDVLFYSRWQCSYEEKLEVFRIVKKIYMISCLERAKGILALEDVAAEQEDTFFKSCLFLAAEGASAYELEDNALNWILINNIGGKRLLEMAVIANGVVQIRKGERPNMIFRSLGAWFGSEFAEKFESTLLERKQQEKISRIETRREGCLQSEHSFFPPFDAIAEYTSEKILRMIKQVERGNLAIALIGASSQVYRTVMDSISQTEQEALEQEMDIIVRPCDVEYAQKAVLGWEKL